nr:bifunctional L-3-cyanoalanine synthase/cysteine synthase 1, mitochondrial [Ipomoea batatas]
MLRCFLVVMIIRPAALAMILDAKIKKGLISPEQVNWFLNGLPNGKQITLMRQLVLKYGKTPPQGNVDIFALVNRKWWHWVLVLAVSEIPKSNVKVPHHITGTGLGFKARHPRDMDVMEEVLIGLGYHPGANTVAALLDPSFWRALSVICACIKSLRAEAEAMQPVPVD